MSVIDERRNQRFPVLNAVQVSIARHFASGPERKFAPGEFVYDVGDRNVPAWLVLEGSIDAVRRDGLQHVAAITSHSAGQLSGEVSQLSGRGTIAGGTAGPQGCVALPFDAQHLRALIIGSAEIGEIVMRAYILRRVGLLEDGGAGSVLVGLPSDPRLIRLQGFLSSNSYPFTVLDAAQEAEGRAITERLGILPLDLPLMICPSGAVLKNPSEAEAANCLGIIPTLDPDKTYDVVVVGAGPAGLATAVYGASEGLKVLVLDQRSAGGQAGASARIENYLGFPTGISGRALAGRAFTQALKFGAEVATPLRVVRLDAERGRTGAGPLKFDLQSAPSVYGRTLVVASGVRYRRPDIASLDIFEGGGVSYWASPVEAKLCEGKEVVLLGGGNSAGQAVAYLAPRVKRVHLVIRAVGLESSMSQYLIDRIAALPNVELHTRTEVTELVGTRAEGLREVVLRNGVTGATRNVPSSYVFLFIGADPNNAWLPDCVATDAKGFVVTGSDVTTVPASAGRARMSLETSCPGVFAIGDVRAGSTKRVSAAVGEGAVVVSQIHQVLGQFSATC